MSGFLSAGKTALLWFRCLSPFLFSPLSLLDLIARCGWDSHPRGSNPSSGLNPDAIAGRRVSSSRSTRLSARHGKIYIAELIVTPLRVSGFCFTGLSGRFYFFKLLFLTYKCKKGKAGSLGGDFFLPAFEKHAWCLE